ncbi:proton extrusion protein PcxA [Fortiea contorta]|uniref:proton extrusion protein PcxA n=1 Tax=Fortiea contorta TaxID=1892405 RepID=UPI000348587C|nr:proton extrusion protein PcxA [Fortiea contorta]
MKAAFFAKSQYLLHRKIMGYLRVYSRWYLDTPQRAILAAYAAAQNIQAVEIEQFAAQKIAPESGNYSENVVSYWQEYLNKNLTIIDVRLAEFRLSYSLVNVADINILEKLQFIDTVVSKYHTKIQPVIDNQLNSVAQPLLTENSEIKTGSMQAQAISKKPGLLPRTLGITINKIKADFSPQAEAEFIKNQRSSRQRTRTSLRFFLILILVPILTQHFSKQLIISPLIERYVNKDKPQIFLNSDMEGEALGELKIFEEKLKFAMLLKSAPEISSERIAEKVKDKALEIAAEFRKKSRDAISNIFADIISLIAFAGVIANSKREIVIVKSFIDNLVYGLSDSAKAFLIILFTDIFVGFHSPHGWEVLLDGLAEHLGLPANRSVIFLFIATFPVILDTIVKYWIFRYLSRLSPSALATLKEMNE